MYAKIRTFLEQSGTPIGPMDFLIASISLANSFILVTNNIREFERIKDRNWKIGVSQSLRKNWGFIQRISAASVIV